MAFVDKYVAEFVRLEVALFHARSRLAANTDSEALHDLRIAVRRVRSLLTPLRSVQEVSGIREAAAEVGRLSTPARDLEVMIGELERQGFPAEAATRRSRLNADHGSVAAHEGLNRLFDELDQFPSIMRQLASEDGTGALEKLISKSLNRHIDKLHAALEDDQFDRHELRILVKRTRYLTEAFPRLSPLSKSAAKSLKSVQSSLGSWHDHFQWCLKVDAEPDLLPLKDLWAEASAAELQQAEAELQTLASLLPRLSSKKKPAS
jgi:CHAD domain-containing protein